ncbi:MAG: hypothetical protein PVH62_05050 [Anaerolineae bacterium]
MSTYTRLVISALVLLSVIMPALPARDACAAPQPPVPFQEGDREYFYRTGYWVQGPFLEFFKTRGELRIFGYPQTNLFYDPELALWVQYFDNARMEWHPEYEDPHKVQLGRLGTILGHGDPPLPRDQWPSNNRLEIIIPETGHLLKYAFLEFYRNHGGADIFGYPISEFKPEGDRLVQYFECMRMEWHPERSRGEQVVVGALGVEYIYRFGVPFDALDRRPAPSRPQTSRTDGEGYFEPASPELRVRAAVRDAVTNREGYQTISVYVTIGSRQPVGEALATVQVYYPSETVNYTLPPTNERGITDVFFSIPSPPPGRKVVVEVRVEYEGMTATTQTSFFPWW